MKRFRNLLWPSGEQGAVAPVVALGLLALTGFMALGIDMGQLFVVKNELQNVADAAALAAAKQLIRPDANNVAVVYCTDAVTAAKNVAAQNHSLGDANPIVVTDADVVVGKWNLNTKQFDSLGCNASPMLVNAVQVTVRRDGGDNDKVSTFLGNVLGVGTQDLDPVTGVESGPAKLSVGATATAYLGLAGTSSLDIPLTVPYQYANGGGTASNGFHPLLDRIGPAPVYAADPQTYRFKDLGGTGLNTTRATFVVPNSGEVTLSNLQAYIKGPGVSGGRRFPQVKVGQKIYPGSEFQWGSNVKSLFTLMKTRWTAKKNASGKWRVTVPVYSITPVTAALPQDSWFRLASQLLPWVSQAHACQAYSVPAVYTQGFMDVDVVNVYVNTTCVTTDGSTQTTNSLSCRNTCYMDLEVPLTTNTVSTDQGASPMPYQHGYQTMNPSASNVGVFAAVPRIVK